MLSVREYNTAVKEHTRNIFRYVFKCVQDTESSNDIVQECFIKLWDNRDNINPDKVKFWLFRTAHNTMINFVKRSSKSISIHQAFQVEPYIQENGSYELKEIIDKALELLPQIQKTILLLRDLEGYNYDEIGEILNLSESQVKVYLFRARQKMKNSLKEIIKTI